MTAPLRQLADYAEARGDLARAITHLERACAMDTNAPALRADLARLRALQDARR